MSDETQVVGRRGVLRGGAIAAGVAAGAVIAGATAQTASAANGDAVTVGGSFTGTAATGLTITGSTTVPTLKLTNATGPSLQLAPVATDPTGNLAIGSIQSGNLGPFIGVSDGTPTGSTTTLLATGNDLAEITVPMAFSPVRLLDTRTASGRQNIVDASSGAFDSTFRLKDGAWIDVYVDDANSPDYTVSGAYLNLTVTGSLVGGFVTVCPGGSKTRPASSTINFTKGQTIANGAFIAVGQLDTVFAVRIYARATTHVLLDLTGEALNYLPGPAVASAAAVKAKRSNAKLRPAARLARVRARKRP